MGGRIHNHLTAAYTYPLHADVLGAAVLGLVHGGTGTYLLPQAFPEGCPLHPAYGAGHATVAGAAVTILKALFVEEWPLPAPVKPSADGSTLVPAGVALTVGGELNKLAENVALGRNMAGVHWRSDARESLRLGERVAVRLLQDLRATYPEPFEGFTFTNFDGVLVTV
jgi:hypothetical protein